MVVLVPEQFRVRPDGAFVVGHLGQLLAAHAVGVLGQPLLAIEAPALRAIARVLRQPFLLATVPSVDVTVP